MKLLEYGTRILKIASSINNTKTTNLKEFKGKKEYKKKRNSLIQFKQTLTIWKKCTTSS